MSPSTEQLWHTAMALPERERLELANALLAGSGAQATAALDAAWWSEVRQRLAEIGAGEADSAALGGPSLDDRWQQSIDEVMAMFRLDDDWDGQGAPAPVAPLIGRALALARDFQAQRIVAADRLIAGANGTILFEWNGRDGYLELEVTAPHQIEGRAVRSGSHVATVFSIPRCS